MLCYNHLDDIKPFGAHRQPEGSVKSLKYSPSSSDFYNRFVHARKPVLIKGAANHWPAMTRWINQSYLREHYGSTRFTVEYRKKFKNEQPNRKPQRLDDFLDIYDKEDVYLDSQFPPTSMLHDVNLPEFLGCEELSQSVQGMSLLFSSGNTTSALHQDGYGNVLTVISGKNDDDWGGNDVSDGDDGCNRVMMVIYDDNEGDYVGDQPHSQGPLPFFVWALGTRLVDDGGNDND